MIQIAGQSVADAVRMMTITPATIMGVAGKKGSLQQGKDADIVIFDDQVNIRYTIIGGNPVYRKEEHATRR
jgi:N-acetylglucosamine-6-phosphate deacetylase